ncbi:MAG: endo-1,4-beta-xylanase [Cyclobacteriaceae bacterium]|nr:endo-1,4-beta-xylanase [Cyclobacteriaceae bacterium]
MKRIVLPNVKILIQAFTAVFIFLSVQVNAQIADGKCKFLGNVIANSVPATFNNYWNQVTPENSGKWGSVEGTRNVMNWGALDLAYNHAKNNGLPFRQHTFVWGQQQPAWITTLMNDSSKPIEERYEEVRGEVEEWIRLYCERYPDTDYIDVVNEPFHATPSYDLALGSGWNWVKWAFEKAREYCPNAKLLLNDYNIINSNSATDSYVSLINILKAEELVDIIGVQCHRFETESAPSATLKANLDKLAATGLPIHITEFDIGNLNNEGTPNDAQQLEIMQRVFPELWNHPAVQGITIWGYIQGQTWQSTAYLLRGDGTERPALTWLKNYVPTVPGGSFCLTTSVEETQPALNIYPNPAPGGRIMLESEGPQTTAIIRDPLGRVVETVVIPEREMMPVQLDAARGIYIIEVRQNQKATYKKVLVN